MRRVLRWVGIAAGGIAALAVVAYGIVYVRSEMVIRRTYDLPRTSLRVPDDPAAVVEGRRLATILGCYRGCHGPEAGGELFLDDPAIARIVSPSLTVAVRRYRDSELDALIRHGLRPDGRSLFVMPSEGFAALNDADLSRIIAFLRSLPASTDVPNAGIDLRPIGRFGVAVGKFKPAAQLVAEDVREPPAHDEPSARGRYIVSIACAHCHGRDLRGESTPEFVSANLGVVKAYGLEDLRKLLRTGVALGGRDLGFMGPIARRNLSLLTDSEIADIYAYLHSLGGT